MKDKKFWEEPFDCQRWWTSPTRAAMNLAARGLYRELLDYQWMEGSVPDNPATVAALLGRPVDEILSVWEQVRGHFSKLKNGTLRNARMEKIRRVKTGTYASRSDIGRKAVSARWQKQRTSDTNVIRSDTNDRTIERSNERTKNKTPLPPGPDFETEWQRLKAAYPKDANLHSQPTESAWVDAVLSATDPPKVLTEVHSGLARMKASGTPTRFMPTLKDFLLNGRFREAWPPEVELPQTAPEPSVIERLKRMGKL
jgi:Arc/MetJ-type ribon-helix-helix transcriptional regulator